MHDQDFLKLNYNQLDKWILLGITQPQENWLEPKLVRSKMAESTFTRTSALVYIPFMTYQQAK